MRLWLTILSMDQLPLNSVICGDCLDVLRTFPDSCIDSVITDPPYGFKFHGKKWDYCIPSVEIFGEILRVAKPGAFLLCFGGSRTFHRLAVAIEDAGWEVRDCMMWLYGSGFPKSLDISKAIDKHFGAEREISGYQSVNMAMQSGNYVKESAEVIHNEWIPVTVPKTEMAKKWHGWGTALKPAYEPILVAMKPMSGTFVDNAFSCGLSGLNIDGARIPVKNDPTKKGRWPANVILDEESATLLDQQYGFSKSNSHVVKRSIQPNGVYRPDSRKVGTVSEGYLDEGGASRFFYCSKASPTERIVAGKRNNHPTVKPLKLMEYLCRLTQTPDGGIVLDPFAGSGTTGIAAQHTGRPFILIEKEAEYAALAKKRLAEGGLSQ